VNPAGDFTSWETAATNIQDAVSAAGAGDLVLVTNGVHTLTNQLVIKTALTLRSFNEGATDRGGTVIDGGYPARTNRCIFVDKVVAVIDGFTITNGFAPAASVSGRGAGVYLNKQGVVSNCVIAGNEAAFNGGGVYLDGGVVADCTIVGNVATNNTGGGGGLYANAAGLVTNCLIRGNSAKRGGGVYLNGASASSGNAVLVDCDVIGNVSLAYTSGDGGGGIYQFYKSLISDCRVISNRAVRVNGTPYGCGIGMGEGGVVRNCLIAYNTGRGYGGGLSQVGKSRTVTNCVIRNNSADNGGGAYVSAGGLLVDSMVVSNNIALFVQGGTMRNCLIAHNGSGIRDFSGPGGLYQNCTIVKNGYGIEIGYSTYTVTSVVENCILYENGASGVNYTKAAYAGIILTNTCTLPAAAGPYDTGNITNAPRLVDSSIGDFRLRGSSPCVNAGVWRDWMTGASDFDGRRRVIGAAVDLGVYEYMQQGTVLQVR